MSDQPATQELQDRLLGKLAFVNSPECIHASLVLDTKTKKVLSAQNLDNPAATAATVSKLWYDAQALAQNPHMLRVNADKQWIIIGGEYNFWNSTHQLQ